MGGQRPTKEEYYIGIALSVAARGTCKRRNYGAVIVADDQIISTGYNGAPRGWANCIDTAPPCQRIQNHVPQGEGYDKCQSVHAEMNAIIHAHRRDMIGATLYLAATPTQDEEFSADPVPCIHCKHAIVNAGIVKVVAQKRDGSLNIMIVQSWKPTSLSPENTQDSPGGTCRLPDRGSHRGVDSSLDRSP